MTASRAMCCIMTFHSTMDYIYNSDIPYSLDVWWDIPSRFVYVHSMTFAQWQNHLTMPFSEHIPVIKWIMTVPPPLDNCLSTLSLACNMIFILYYYTILHLATVLMQIPNISRLFFVPIFRKLLSARVKLQSFEKLFKMPSYLS